MLLCPPQTTGGLACHCPQVSAMRGRPQCSIFIRMDTKCTFTISLNGRQYRKMRTTTEFTRQSSRSKATQSHPTAHTGVQKASIRVEAAQLTREQTVFRKTQNTASNVLLCNSVQFLCLAEPCRQLLAMVLLRHQIKYRDSSDSLQLSAL